MSEQSAGSVERWQVPAIDGSSGNGFMTASRLQELQQQAYDEAWEKGYEDGVKAGHTELEARADRLDRLLMALAEPFDQLDETVEKQLVDLAMTVVRKLFRRELKSDPSHVIGVVREAIRLLPVASRDVEVLLHPDDASLVRESLTSTEGERAWTLVEDPLIQRGGCKVNTQTSQIDAQSDTRLRTLIASIVGDERQP